MANSTPHNHERKSNFDRRVLGCPRCEELAAKSGRAIHTCEHGGAFGRRDAECAGCSQLLARAIGKKSSSRGYRPRSEKTHHVGALLGNVTHDITERLERQSQKWYPKIVG